MVLETQKSTLDTQAIKQLLAEFNKVLEHLEEAVKAPAQSVSVDLSQLKITRSHRAAALALIGE
jgi:hypothetical protein